MVHNLGVEQAEREGNILCNSREILMRGARKMRGIIVASAVVVGAIVLLNLSQVGSALADEVECMACKAQAQSACIPGINQYPDDMQRCIRDYIARLCAEKCRKKSGEDD